MPDTAVATVQFEEGRTYSCRSVCDYDSIFRFTVLSRTPKFVVLDRGEGRPPVRVGVKVHDDVEYVLPLGRYSMAPVLRADREEA